MRAKYRHLSPHKTGDGWWYEDDSGIDVYDGNGNPGVRIQYRHILSAAKRAEQRNVERSATAYNSRKRKGK